jgi:DNA-binding XRE family transcriptional regulator
MQHSLTHSLSSSPRPAALIHSQVSTPARAPTSLDQRVPAGDPLWQLPRGTMAAMVQGLGVCEAEQLLDLPEAQVLSKVRACGRLGTPELAELSHWLCRLRLAQDDPITSPIGAKSRADDVVTLARHRLATAVRAAIRNHCLTADDVAKRCGTSRDAVALVMAGGTPASLELALRMAAVLGVQVEIGVCHAE